jgi:hypothetical protein
VPSFHEPGLVDAELVAGAADEAGHQRGRRGRLPVDDVDALHGRHRVDAEHRAVLEREEQLRGVGGAVPVPEPGRDEFPAPEIADAYAFRSSRLDWA